MSDLKRHLRRILAALLYYSGVLWLIAEYRLRGHAVVLMYHRVLPGGADTFSHYGIVIEPVTFERQMRFLKKHFRLLTPDQFQSELTGPGFGRRACLVTIDDGWQDNHHHALPILKRTGVPVVVFVATSFIGTPRTFWQERLTRLLFAASRSAAFGDEVLQELGIADARNLDDAQAKDRVRTVVTSLKRRDAALNERLIERLADEAGRAGHDGSHIGDDRFMTWSDLQELQESELVLVASHAHTHTPLPSLGYEGAKAELARAQQELQGHDIRAPSICAYPNGNVDQAVVTAARDTGMTLGFATGHGRVRNGDDPFRLRRINVHELSSGTPAEFLCLILGVL